jgi:chromosome segregation ATPase
MITLEQVKLLESKAARTIEYVERVSRENAQLQGKLDSYQKRIDELEVLIRHFKVDHGRIEDCILEALDKLNKFEDAIERSISSGDKKTQKAIPPVPAAPAAPANDLNLTLEVEPETEPDELELINEDSLSDEGKEEPENGELDIF